MIAWFTRNGVAANLMMAFLIVGGLFSVFTVNREMFPQFSLEMVVVRMPYRGASPAQIEEAVLIRIEEAIEGINGIKEVMSVAQEGYGSVTAMIERGYDVSRIKDEIKARVDAIPSFPAETERPIVEEPLIDRNIIWIAIYGEADERNLKVLGEKIRDELVEIPGISQVSVWGGRRYEISIEVSESQLRKYGISFDAVVRAVRSSSLDLPGGTIKTSGGEIQLRTKEQGYTGADFEKIVLLTNPNGARVYLGDVATIRDAFEEEDLYSWFNGHPATHVKIDAVKREDSLDVAAKVYSYVDEVKETWLPEGLELAVWGDFSFYLEDRLNLLLKNGLYGFLLVALVLAVFLRPSLALFVVIGIPVSFLGTLMIAPLIGVTVNLISLFAFILVLGIVVDDAIVVGESVFTEFQKNGPGTESAIRGTHAVSTPVIFAVITTMVAFTPIFMIEGLIGKFLAVIPMIVIPTLFFSLVQSKLVLPYHLSLCRVGDRVRREELNLLSRFQRRFSDGLERFIHTKYRRLLNWAMENRYLTVVIFFALLAISFGFVVGGWVRFVYFPNVPSDYIVVELKMAEGIPVSETKRVLDRIEVALDEITEEEIEGGNLNPVKYKGVFLGYSPIAMDVEAMVMPQSASNVGALFIELSKSEFRHSNAFEISRRWRDAIGLAPGARRLTFQANAGGPTGRPVDIRLSGPDIEDLKEAAELVRQHLAQYQGLYDIRDTVTEGKREIKIHLKERARMLGLTAADLGRQVRQAFFGEEVQRVPRDREDIRIMVRYPKEERISLGNFESMWIRTSSGAEIPVSEVADVEVGEGYSAITRVDGQRVINIQSDANKEVADVTGINKDLYSEDGPLAEITAGFPGMKFLKSGEAKEMEETLGVLYQGFVLVSFAIYMLLAIPFRSYIQPLIVICVIPFGIAGAIFGHFLTGQNLSMFSLLGMIALAGVVVNDSLVLVDYINRLRRSGASVSEAVWEGGVARFRPILLTSVTTFAGLTPILLETSLQAQFLIPMATSLGFGVLFATSITLILVPMAYLILEDTKALFAYLFRGSVGNRTRFPG